MSDLKDLIDTMQSLALANKIEPDEASIYRSYCRYYSKNFNTPLHLVEQMDPEKVLEHCLEDQMEDLDVEEKLENILDVIYGLEDPEYRKSQESELNEFIEETKREEKERLKKGKAIHPSLKPAVEKVEEPLETEKPKELPRQGGINLEYLEAQELEQMESDQDY